MKKNLTQLCALALSLFIAAGPALAQERAVLPEAASAPAPISLGAVDLPQAAAAGDVSAVQAVDAAALAAPASAVAASVSAPASAGAVAVAPASAAKAAAPLARLVQASAEKFSPAAVARLFGDARGVVPPGQIPPSATAVLRDAGLSPVRRQRRRLKLPPGVNTVKPVSSFKGRISPVERNHYAVNQVLADGSAPVALDVDLNSYNLNDKASRAQAMAAVETALQKLVDSDPSRYGASADFGAPSQDMGRVHVRYAPGLVGDPSIFALFRQWKRGTQKDGSPYRVGVEGGQMRFHIKVFNGKPYVMSYSGGFASIDPSILPARYSDDDMARIAQQQLRGDGTDSARSARPRRRSSRARRRRTLADGSGSSEDDPAGRISFIGRQIAPLGQDQDSTQWRVLDLFQGSDLGGNQAIVAVDANTGEAFVINPQDMRVRGPKGAGLPVAAAQAAARLPAAPPVARATAQASSEAGAITGQVLGRGNSVATGEDHGPIVAMPMAHAYVIDDATGKVVAITDQDGKFTVPASVTNGKAMRLRVGPNGIYSPVKDADPKDPGLSVTQEAAPGQEARFLLNPTGSDEQLTASINAYVDVYGLIDWVKANLADLGMEDARFNDAIVAIVVNSTEMVLNAFFNPADKTLNLMKRGQIQQRVRARDGSVQTVTITGENTAQLKVDRHEDTHSLDSAASQFDLSDAQKANPEYRYVDHLVEAVMGGDTDEGTADLGSMLSTDNPEIGNGFLISIVTQNGRSLPLPNPNDIRNGTNKIPYQAFDPNDPNSDPHQSGNTLMGTAWMSYQDLIGALGHDPALKAAFRHFFLACLYMQPSSAASALSHMIIEGLRADGSNALAPIIRRHAQDDHGLNLGTESSTSA